MVGNKKIFSSEKYPYQLVNIGANRCQSVPFARTLITPNKNALNCPFSDGRRRSLEFFQHSNLMSSFFHHKKKSFFFFIFFLNIYAPRWYYLMRTHIATAGQVSPIWSGWVSSTSPQPSPRHFAQIIPSPMCPFYQSGFVQ